jgi:chromate transporter
LSNTSNTVPISTHPAYTLWQLVLYFLRLGTFGFGGPVALVGYMHRDLVERHGWISEADYKEGIALAQLAPGPMAAQTAIYLGYVHYRTLGATLVGLAFVLPSFFMVVLLGWAYQQFGGLEWMHAVFYGVGAAVIGIIAISAHKLTQEHRQGQAAVGHLFDLARSHGDYRVGNRLAVRGGRGAGLVLECTA